MTLSDPHHFPKTLTDGTRHQVLTKTHHAAGLKWEVYWGERGIEAASRRGREEGGRQGQREYDY